MPDPIDVRHGRVPHVRGLVLAAGAGRRMGGPKALVRATVDGPTLVERAVHLLTAGGCDGVTVVVGAAGEEVESLVRTLGRDVDVTPCPDWDEGMGASLRAGLAALASGDARRRGLDRGRTHHPRRPARPDTRGGGPGHRAGLGRTGQGSGRAATDEQH